MLPVVGWDATKFCFIQTFAHPETEIKQNCRRSAETKFCFFFSSFISRCATGFRLLRYTVGSSSMECLLRWQRDSTLTTSITNVFRHSGVFGIRHFLYVGTSITALVLLRKWGGGTGALAHHLERVCLNSLTAMLRTTRPPPLHGTGT